MSFVRTSKPSFTVNFQELTDVTWLTDKPDAVKPTGMNVTIKLASTVKVEKNAIINCFYAIA